MKTRKVVVLLATVTGLLALTAVAAYANSPGSHNGRLAFAKLDSDGRHIYSVLPNGNDLRQLTSGPSKDACPSYSPDGKSVVFCSFRSASWQV